MTKPDKNWHSTASVMRATRDNHGINPLDCFHLGVHRVLLSGHIHSRNHSQNPSTRLCITSWKLFKKLVEHHGFCCGSYGVSFNLPFENDTPKFQRNCLFTEMDLLFWSTHTKKDYVHVLWKNITQNTLLHIHSRYTHNFQKI